MSDDKELLTEIATDVRWIRRELESLREEINNHEERIRDLEKFKYEITGALIFISSAIGVIIALLNR